MSRILVIGDVHEPCSRKGALAFCSDLRDEYDPDQVIFIGDIVDMHSISFHAHHPEMPGPNDECELAHERIQLWYEQFPSAIVTIGNHDRRVIRKAEDASIPSRFLRNFAEAWDTPGWQWVEEQIIDEVRYIHGDGAGTSLYPAYNMVRAIGMSCVLGHHHSAGGIKWLVNPLRRMFGMDTGCLIDDEALAFAYSKRQVKRSVLSACVVLDGMPIHIPMPCGRGEKYHDSRFDGSQPKKVVKQKTTKKGCVHKARPLSACYAVCGIIPSGPKRKSWDGVTCKNCLRTKTNG